MKSQERKNKLIYLLIFVFLIIICFLFYINLNAPILTKEYELSFEVSDGVGFDLNDSALKFGKVVEGSESSKELNVENMYSFPIEVRVYASDSIKDFVYIKEKIFIEPGQTSSFLVYLKVPEDQNYGNYSGKITIGFFKI